MPPSAFAQALAARQPASGGPRRYLFVPYDQLTDQLGPLAREPAGDLGIVLVEAPAKARRRPYHRQKLALVLTNLRHFAVEQAARGVAVRHVVAEDHEGYAGALRRVAAEVGPLRMMEAAERELRAELAPLVADGTVEVLPHEGWLTTPAEFTAWAGRVPWRMDAFYRGARRARGILMEGGAFAGGKLSFDAENRQAWRGDPPAPAPMRFLPDAITREVCALVERAFPDHPGAIVPEDLPASAADAEAAWRWARDHALPRFGPFEDAMSTRSDTLFHTRISALLNLHRLLPARIVADAAAMDLPLASQEGFLRQILGWREFVRHVHLATDGFRSLAPAADAPGDAGWARWAGQP